MQASEAGGPCGGARSREIALLQSANDTTQLLLLSLGCTVSCRVACGSNQATSDTIAIRVLMHAGNKILTAVQGSLRKEEREGGKEEGRCLYIKRGDSSFGSGLFQQEGKHGVHSCDLTQSKECTLSGRS